MIDDRKRDVVGASIAPGVADTTIGADGKQLGYVVLSDEERARGFVRPVRATYRHVGPPGGSACGTVTRMGYKIAETYARDPSFYTGTFCVKCKAHFPVGADGEFVWDGTDERVGT